MTQTLLFPISIDGAIVHDNEVCLIDLFVEKLDLGELGVDTEFDKNGRPSYHLMTVPRAMSVYEYVQI